MDVKQAIEILTKKGYKTTGRRKDILAFFEQADGYRTAKDLLQFMEEKYEGISPDTVYRNLHLYAEMKILENTELNGEKHFRMKCTTHHHHHFICSSCGKTKEINVCPMEEVENKLPDYRIEDHKFEIYGLCPSC
ncbi:transcriptional repressor [Oceanobacillus luteolus]|uniref:Fur family transcriptional regulator n=1 Tax=Oceanobacillus luteolus TaxID=1274358 RepID=A0ABW4HRY1_9BACI|nr:Fur family transcriptional regulator [Oceanobacillus luteolus]MCM3739304.1 transcriptional repressor [Oceanobacillus luteolus]